MKALSPPRLLAVREKIEEETDLTTGRDLTKGVRDCLGCCLLNVYGEASCSWRARDAVEWWNRPLWTADMASSMAIEVRFSSLDGISPEHKASNGVK